MPEGQNAAPGSSLIRQAIAVGTVLIFVFGILYALASIRGAFLLLFIAILLAVILRLPIDLLSRRVPRGLAVVMVLFACIGLFALLLVLVAPTLSSQLAQLGQALPRAIDNVDRFWLRVVHSGAVTTISHGPLVTDGVATRWTRFMAQLSALVIPLAESTLLVTGGLVFTLALAFFFAYEPDSYREGLRALLPASSRGLLDENWRQIGVALQHWLVGILVSMTIMGTLTAVGLLLAGINGWFALALITFAATFVPYVGAATSAIPGLAVGLAQSPRHFAYALVVYAGVHFVEGYLVEPLVMKRAVALRPATLLFWQVLMAGVFGVLGIIAATPLLVCVQVAVSTVRRERV